MDADPGLKKATAHYRALSPFVDALVEHDIRLEVNHVKQEVTRRRRIKALSIAAGILIIVCTGIWFFMEIPVSGEEIYASYYRYPMSDDVRGKLPKDVIGPSDSLDFSSYMLAHDLLGEGSIEKAAEIFIELGQNADSPYGDHAQWYLMLLQFREDSLANAKRSLEVILQDPEHKYYQKARTIEKQLSEGGRD